MNVCIRTDSSIEIGSGHVMRCLTLAEELRLKKAEVAFICRELPGNLIGIIEARGFRVHRLPSPDNTSEQLEGTKHANWLGVSWQTDAKQTIQVLPPYPKPNWLIVDHYSLDQGWEKRVRALVNKIMVIDDLADRSHDCDLLLDQNLYDQMETRYDMLVPKSIKLLGPKYALLRPEFAAARKNLRQRDGQVKRVLVFFGGIDATQETEKALEALLAITDRQFDVDVVVGKGNPREKKIELLCSEYEHFHYHCQIDNMAELMTAADLAIGAGGISTWERCALGLPTIVISVASNQIELAKTGARNGLFFHLGDTSSVSSKRIVNALILLMSSPECLQMYSERGLACIDANGAPRVSNLLCLPKIYLRKAEIEDCDAIYVWRNHEETRRYIFDTRQIPLETHRKWYVNTLSNPNIILLIGEINTKPVGVLRYDLSESEAKISIYLVPGVKGQGIGAQLIRCGSEWIRDKHHHIRVISAEIFKENPASLSAFKSAGFREHHLTLKKVLQ